LMSGIVLSSSEAAESHSILLSLLRPDACIRSDARYRWRLPKLRFKWMVPAVALRPLETYPSNRD